MRMEEQGQDLAAVATDRAALEAAFTVPIP